MSGEKGYFSGYFQAKSKTISDYGAIDISLVSDLPLFIDPFLLFNSKNKQYQQLHKDIINYLQFLRQKSLLGGIDKGLITAWYKFSEVSQNWFGYSQSGNRGSGLGNMFAQALNKNLHRIFRDFGTEKITQGSHLEKLCLIEKGVGKDHISDFTTNLIKEFLLEYTQEFAKKHIDKKFLKNFAVAKVCFNYKTETWETKTFLLPEYKGDYVLLTPRDILTLDDTWINKSDLVSDFEMIPNCVENDQMRGQINNYFLSQLPEKATKKDKSEAAIKTIRKYPELFDYYIKRKEEQGDIAVGVSAEKVKKAEELFIARIKELVPLLHSQSQFYELIGDTYKESLDRVSYLKRFIESNDGYRFFYLKGSPIKREEDLQLLYKLVWHGSPSDVNREVNNGRGDVDFKVSRGSADKTLVEFKLASNTKLRQNLAKQVEIYEEANDTKKSLKVIMFFTQEEEVKVRDILSDLGLAGSPNVILIDARNDNKPSASNA